MKHDIVILRPEPGAGLTAARASALGLRSLMSPLFTIRALSWDPPQVPCEAILLTSANAARTAGDGISRFLHLPCYAVGETTALAARQRGFAEVRIGSSDGEEIVKRMVEDGVRSAFHPCGRDHLPLGGLSVELTSIPVYESLPIPTLPAETIDALVQGATALIHSPAAGRHFRDVIEQAGIDRGMIQIAAISQAAGAAAGEGWKLRSVAERPRDEALLELAAKLCKVQG